MTPRNDHAALPAGWLARRAGWLAGTIRLAPEAAAYEPGVDREYRAAVARAQGAAADLDAVSDRQAAAMAALLAGPRDEGQAAA